VFNFGKNPQTEVVFYWSISGAIVGGYGLSTRKKIVFRVFG